MHGLFICSLLLLEFDTVRGIHDHPFCLRIFFSDDSSKMLRSAESLHFPCVSVNSSSIDYNRAEHCYLCDLIDNPSFKLIFTIFQFPQGTTLRVQLTSLPDFRHGFLIFYHFKATIPTICG